MLLDKIKKQIDKADIISFDIFDTLLVRPYVHPNDLFNHLAELGNIPDFRKMREVAFEQAIHKYKNEEVEEVTLDKIYEFVPTEYHYMKNLELDIEGQVLQQNLELKEIYDYSLAKNKKIIIVSDMFLPKDFIEKVLAKNGYDKYAKLYLSSEYKKLKYTGNLFKIVLKEENVVPKKILHIGDNKYSDYKSPKKLGIQAIRYTKISEQFFNKNKKAKKFYKRHSDNLTISILMGSLALKRNEKHNYWYKLGFNYGGAFIFSYMFWLRNILSQDNINEILFVARDGYTLEKVYNLLQNNNENTHYFYAPRLISMCCTLDIEDKIRASEFECVDAISSIINYYKSQTKSNIDNSELKTKNEYLSFWEQHKSYYQKLSQKETEKYKEYLLSLNLNEDKIAFVDVMTTFFTGHKFIQDVLSDKIIKGYYYFVSDYYNCDRSNLNFENYTNKFFNIKFMELLVSSPEPPIIGIDNNNPIYKNITKYDQYRMNIYPDISQGELDFAKLLKSYFGKYLIQLDTELICEWIDSFAEKFTMEDYFYLRKLSHSWNANHSKYSLLFDELSTKHLIQNIFSIKNSNDNTHKIIKILGLQLKFKRKNK